MLKDFPFERPCQLIEDSFGKSFYLYPTSDGADLLVVGAAVSRLEAPLVAVAVAAAVRVGAVAHVAGRVATGAAPERIQNFD